MNRYVFGAIVLALSAILGSLADASAALQLTQNLPGRTNNP